MGRIDQTIDRKSLAPYGRPNESPANVERPALTDPLYDNPPYDDPLAAARGVVCGALLGAFLWAAILWALSGLTLF